MFIPIEKTGFVYTLDGRTIGYQDPAAIAGVRTPFKGSMCSTFSRVYIETPVTRFTSVSGRVLPEDTGHHQVQH